MMFRRRRKERSWRWLVAGFAPLVAWAVWVIREAVQRRRRESPAASRWYGMETPPGSTAEDFRIATGDLGEAFAGTPLTGEAANIPMPARVVAEAARLARVESAARAEYEDAVTAQVPVTAKKRPPARAGGARLYESQAQVAHPGGSRARDTRAPAAAERRPIPWLLILIPLVILSVVVVMGVLGRQPARAHVVAVPGGNAEAGRQAIQAWGCGSCHTIPGIAGAQGKVGPRLEGLSERTYIAGILPNTPENMIEWIMNPQEIQPGNAMPDTDVPPPTARDMAAYLYMIP